MQLEDGPLYTPEQVCENGWLGPDATPGGIRKAAGLGRIEHTRYPPGSKRGRIYLTAANVRSIQAAGLRQAGETSPAPNRSGRRKSGTVTELRAGVPGLTAQPDRARKARRSRKAS